MMRSVFVRFSAPLQCVHRSAFCRKTDFWGINGPKMGCIDDKLILLLATEN